MRTIFSTCALAYVSAFLTACVSVDQRASTEVVDRERARTLSGEFTNGASYRTRGEFIAVGNLAELFHVPASGADRVRITRDAADTLRLTWFQGPREWETITFARDKLHFPEDGSIEIPAETRSSFKEGAGGYTTTTLRLFVTTKGDLATIQTNSSVGVIGIVPVGLHAKHLALFARLP